MLKFTEEQLDAAMDRAVDRCIHIDSREERAGAIRRAVLHEGIALATAAFQNLLAEACGSALSSEQIDKLERLALAATPGPWAVDALQIDARYNIELPDGSEAIAMAQQLASDSRSVQRGANADFIAAAHPQTVLALINQMRAAQAGLLIGGHDE